MMISDAELLKLVMDRYPEQPAQFLIEQFTVMKAGLIQANNKLAGMDSEALSESFPSRALPRKNTLAAIWW